MRNYIIKQLNIDSERIKNLNIIQKEDGTDFYVELVHSFPECPYCGGNTISNGHGRPKPINHPTIVNENNRIIFKPIRYKCKDCGKTFTEENPFTFSTFRNSYFALDQIMKDIANLTSHTMISQSRTMSVLLLFNDILTALFLSLDRLFQKISALMKSIPRWLREVNPNIYVFWLIMSIDIHLKYYHPDQNLIFQDISNLFHYQNAKK